MSQKVLQASAEYKELDTCFSELGVTNFLLVCGSSIKYLKINDYFKNLTARTGIEFSVFSDFVPNPQYVSVEKGVKVFKESGAEMIVAVGGGSALDVAKCIKLYSNMQEDACYLDQQVVPNDIPLLAIPTTSGSGSEATRYAVIYYKGQKQSVADYSIIPSVVLLDSSVLRTLPLYQKKSTMLDAFCHAIESFWSVNSTEESREYSNKAIKLILSNMEGYLNNEDEANANMLLASNLAGKAINITQTTAGHAMCYKITSLFGFAHGHAAALCVSKLWAWMLDNVDKCVDLRGQDFLRRVFSEITSSMKCKSDKDAVQKFQKIVDNMNFEKVVPSENDFDLLKSSVNPVRLKNHPILLDEKTIDYLYHII